MLKTLAQWFDAHAISARKLQRHPEQIQWLRVIPFILMHVACFGVIWVGVSYTAVIFALALYALRVFALTAFYHRYFSHRAFKTHRVWQFIFAFIGATSAQRGPLWWASHHRQHHKMSDQPEDQHSPRHHGFWYSHMGWFLVNKNYLTRFERVKDWLRFPELVWLNRFDVLPPIMLAVVVFALGAFLASYYPELGTNAWQLLVWGFFISTVAVFHVTFSINSIAHKLGKRRFATKDDSRNNAILALLSFGEGWHNNHHHYPSSARQGMRWWEIDISYYLLKMLACCGVVKELR
jgi:stearoyl-CoA desaturase (delta-9 desaturase)